MVDLGKVMEIFKDVGAVVVEVKKDLSDGKMSAEELAALMPLAFELISDVASLFMQKEQAVG